MKMNSVVLIKINKLSNGEKIAKLLNKFEFRFLDKKNRTVMKGNLDMIFDKESRSIVQGKKTSFVALRKMKIHSAVLIYKEMKIDMSVGLPRSNCDIILLNKKFPKGAQLSMEYIAINFPKYFFLTD